MPVPTDVAEIAKSIKERSEAAQAESQRRENNETTQHPEMKKPVKSHHQ